MSGKPKNRGVVSLDTYREQRLREPDPLELPPLNDILVTRLPETDIVEAADTATHIIETATTTPTRAARNAAHGILQQLAIVDAPISLMAGPGQLLPNAPPERIERLLYIDTILRYAESCLMKWLTVRDQQRLAYDQHMREVNIWLTEAAARGVCPDIPALSVWQVADSLTRKMPHDERAVFTHDILLLLLDDHCYSLTPDEE